MVLFLSCKIFCKAAWSSGESCRMGCGAGVLPTLALCSPVFSCSVCPRMKRGWTAQFGIRQCCGVAEQERLECCRGLGCPVGSAWAGTWQPAPSVLQPRARSHHTTWQSQGPSSLGQTVSGAGEERLREPEGSAHLKRHDPFLSAVQCVSPAALCLSHSFGGLLQGFICL